MAAGFYGSSIASLSGLPETPQAPQIDMDQPEQLALDTTTLLSEAGQASQPQVPTMPKYSVKTDAQGRKTYDVTLSEEGFNKFQELATRGAQAGPLTDLAKIGYQAVAARQAEIERLKGNLKTIEKYPIIAQLGRLASLAATAYIAPGSRGEALVHAAGAFASPLIRQTPEILSAQIAEAEQDKVRTMLPIAEMESREADRAANRALAERGLNLQEETARENRIAREYGTLSQQAGQGEPPNLEAAKATLIAAGASKKQADVMVANLESQAQSAVKRSKEEFDRETERMRAMQEANFKHQEALERERKKEANKDRDVQIAFGALNAAYDDRSKLIAGYTQGRQAITDTYTQLYPGKAVPADPDRAAFEIRAALADPKNEAAKKFKQNNPDAMDKMGETLTGAVSNIKNYAIQTADIENRIAAAKSILPEDTRKILTPEVKEAPKPVAEAAPVEKTPRHVVDQMDINTFVNKIPELLNSGQYTQAELADYLDKKKKSMAAQPVQPRGFFSPGGVVGGITR